jgi:sigma-B regulation protein RsbU (phosphoserine phosphatase)
LRAELRLAEQVQISMLPRRLPAVGGLEFGAIYRPCTQLSGDFFNVFRLDRDHVGMYVGDVSGHGVAAALLGVFAMQRIVTKQIDGSEYRILPPSESLDRLNTVMLDSHFPDDFFLTLTYGIFDTRHATWNYASAGHPSSLLFRRNGSVMALEAEGPPLGLLPAHFQDETIAIGPGDRLLLFTDGVDTMQWGGHGRATAGMIAAFPRRHAASSQALLDSLEAEAEPAEGILDDLTLLLLEWTPVT